MLSDEEKEAIEEQYKKGLVNLSNVIEPLINQFKIDYSLDIQQCRLIINYLLMERDFDENYYEELEKEVQELKEENKKLTDEYLVQRDLINPDFLKDYIHKNKIKEILHLTDEECNSEEKILSLLETIWDEFNRLEDIEDRKVQVDYERVFNKGVKSVQDKIKAKIEELDKEEKEALKGTKGQDRYAIKQEYMHKRSVLQSLLEKE